MKKVLLALTIGWAAVLAGCYDTGDQAMLDNLLNEKEETAVNAKQAAEEIRRLKSEIETLKVKHRVKLEAKDRAVENATKRIRGAKNDLQRLEKRLRDEETGRQKAQREIERLKNIIEAAKNAAAYAAIGRSERTDPGKKQESAMKLIEGEKHKKAREEKERQKAAIVAAKKRAVAKAARKKKEAVKARKRAATRTAENARRRKAAAERTRRLDEEYRRREAERLASSRGRSRRKIKRDSLSNLGR